MEAILVLLAIGFVLCGPLALIFALVAQKRQLRLEVEVADLRRRLRKIESGPTVPSDRSEPVARTTAPVAPRVTPAKPSQKPAATTPPRKFRPRREFDIETILGGQWLTWTGILALFFGTAFFLGVDLGPSALAELPQVLIGLAVAGAFVGLGRWLSVRRERILGLGLLGGGVALLYLAAYAAYGFHALIPMWVAFPLLLVVAIVGALLALDRNSMAIAALTLIGALLTPVLLDGGRPAILAFLPYLLAVNVGAVVVGLRRGWAGLPLAAFIVSAVMIPGWWDDHFASGLRLYAVLCISGMWLLYAIAPWLRRGPTPFWSVARALVVAGNGLLYSLFWYSWLAPEWTALRGAALAAQAALYVGGALWLRGRFGEEPAVRLTYFTGIALAILAVAVQLNAAWVTLAWTALACLLIHAGLREGERTHRIAGLAVFGLVLLRSVFFEVAYPFLATNDFRPIGNEDFLAGLVVVGALVWLSWMLRRHDNVLGPVERKMRPVILIIASATLAWKISFELITYYVSRDATHNSDLMWVGVQALFLFWSIYGLALHLAGRRIAHGGLRLFGFVLVGASAVLTALLTVAAGTDLYDGYRPILNLPFLQGCAVAGILAVLYLVLRNDRKDRKDRKDRNAAKAGEMRLMTPLLISAILLLFAKVSYEVVAYFLITDPGDVTHQLLRLRSRLTLSLVWALYSGAVIVSGFAARLRAVRILGMSLLGLTVAKVFLVDIQMLDRGYRIAAFVGLGVLLLAVSLLYQRQKKSESRGETA